MEKSSDRILIIDENNSFNKGLLAGLSQVGFSMALVPGLAIALQSLLVLKPDMIILHHLSDESLETCRQLHDAFCIPVILVGADYNPEIWRKALIEAKADFYVRKPFYMEELVARLQAILWRYKLSEIKPELHERSTRIAEL